MSLQGKLARAPIYKSLSLFMIKSLQTKLGRGPLCPRIRCRVAGGGGHKRQGRGIPWTSKLMTKCKQMEAHVDMSLVSVKYGPHDSFVVVKGCPGWKLVLSTMWSIINSYLSETWKWFSY